jgi:hypothetical protein
MRGAWHQTHPVLLSISGAFQDGVSHKAWRRRQISGLHTAHLEMHGQRAGYAVLALTMVGTADVCGPKLLWSPQAAQVSDWSLSLR